MRVTSSKSKNSESFYITQSYTDINGKSTSKVIRKLGTLKALMEELGTDRDGVVKWAKEQARIETEKYKQGKEIKTVLIPFQCDEREEYKLKKTYEGGYLFLQKIYYDLKLDQVCRKIKNRHKFKYDLNAILSDLVYTRILDPASKLSSFKAASRYLEPPTYELHDIYRALSVLAEECDFIQAEVYKNSRFVCKRNDHILYYDCTNYYFEIEQESGSKKYGKSKEHRPNPIIQMGLFTDGDGIPLAFSLFPGNQNEQKSLKPLEMKILKDFGCDKFIYCSDAGLGSESNRELNHMGQRAFVVTQSIRKLPAEDRAWALDKTGFRRLSNHRKVDITNLPDEDMDSVFYKEEPYTTKRLDQRLIVTYSPKYAEYQKAVRQRQVERACKMVQEGSRKTQRNNPNDPARFVKKISVTAEGEVAKDQYFLDEAKIADEAQYDGLYAVCTDLLDDDPAMLLKVSEGRWRIEECFRIMKTEFEARPTYVRREDRIQAHFLTCFLALLVYRLLEKKLGGQYTCETILSTLKSMTFVDINGQGFMPGYQREAITDALHDICNIITDYKLIPKCKMREIEKLSKGRQ